MATKVILRKIYDEAFFQKLDFETFQEVLAELQQRGYTMGLADGYTIVKAGELGSSLAPETFHAITEQAEAYAMAKGNELYSALVLSSEYFIGGKRAARAVSKAFAARDGFR